MIVVVGLFVALGCQRYEGIPAGVFVYNEPSGIASLDPAYASYQAAWWVGLQLFNGLVDFDSTLGVVPALALQWNVDSTYTRWRFQLRSDVWFHENPCFGSRSTRRCTAYDVQYSIERILDARTRSPGLWVFLDRILGARDYHQATRNGTPLEHCRGIRVINDTTIELVLTAPFAPFLALLTMPYAWVVPREAVEYYGERFGEHPVGTGPFRFVEWIPDRHVVLARNTRYWKRNERGERLPYLQQVRVEFLRDQRTEMAEFRRGRFAMLSSLDPAFAAVVLTAEGKLSAGYQHYQLLTAPALSTEYYGMLLDTALEGGRHSIVARSPVVRQALNYALDRARIVRYVLRGSADEARGILPLALARQTAPVYSYNPDRARALLAQAGYPNGRGLPPLKLVLSTSTRTLSVAEAVQQQWAEVGIRVELQQVDFPRLLAMVRAGEIAFWRTSWVADYPDAENFLALFVCAYRAPAGPNTTRYCNPVVDRLYAFAVRQVEHDRRQKVYQQLEHIVVQDAPWVFLFHGRILRLVQPFVKGLQVDPMDRLVLERVQVIEH